MKVAFYVEDGREQIVLTPETETERGIIGKMRDDTRVTKIYQGSFYACQGGWTRMRDDHGILYGCGQEDDRSTIIVLEKAKP